MKFWSIGICLSAALLAAPAFAQSQLPAATSSPPDVEGMYQHLKRARAAAGADLFMHYNWRCIVDGVYPAMSNAIQRSGIAFEPLKVFDQLYFLGQRGASAWALDTSDGIVMFDALNNEEDAQKTIVSGLVKLGLDPKRIKYVVITHGHGDHFGGANYLKTTFGARIISSERDWAVMQALKTSTTGPARWAALVPEKDIVVGDGQTMNVGDTALTFYVTPGHTPGTVSTIFKVTDGGTTHTVGFFGGLGTPRSTADKKTLMASYDRWTPVAASAGVDVLIANHEEQEQSMARMEELKLRRAGDPNPYVIGGDTYRRYFEVQKECTRYRMARAGEK